LTGAGGAAGGGSIGGASAAGGGTNCGGTNRVGNAPGAGAVPADPLARWVFAALVLACLAAFVITQRLKHTPTAVQSFKLTPIFAPVPTGHIKAERISFKLANAERVTVTILAAGERTVATLVRDWPVARYKQFSLRWNGREGAAHIKTVAAGPDGTTIVTPINTGGPAPAGEYHVRVYLSEQHRTVLSPVGFTLVRP
jgi:hypothetical protein